MSDLAHCVSAADFDQHVAHTNAAFDALNSRTLASSATTLACRAGCSLCCSLRVDVFAHEVLHLAAHLRVTRTPEDLAALQNRLATHAEKVRPLTPFAHATQNIPCPLLHADGRCSAYAARPQSCRRHHSRELAACEYTYDHPDDLDTPAAHDRELYRTLTAPMQQNIDAYFDAGFDVTIYELSTALEEALRDPACWSRWLAREQTFLHASITPAG